MMALRRHALEGAGGSSSAPPAGSKDRFRCPRGVRAGSARMDRLVLVQALPRQHELLANHSDARRSFRTA